MNTPDMLIMAVGLLVALAIAGGLYTHRLGLSHLLIFLVVGMLAGVDGPLGIPFDDYQLAVSVGSLALALILLDGGLRTRWQDVRVATLPAGLLATLGVALTSGVVAVLAHAAMDLPWLQGWLLGAAIASTDASAVFAQFTASRLHLPPRVAATIEVESALNDPMAMVLTVALLAVLVPGQAQGPGLPMLLLQHLGLGSLAGLGGGWLAAQVLRVLPWRDDHDGLCSLMIAALGLFTYACVSRLEGSGFLAIYLFGLMLRSHAGAVSKRALAGLNGYTWLAQAAMFLLLGLLATPHELLRLAAPAIAVALGLMLLGRPLAVLLCLAPLRFGWREQVFVAWAGLRGAVPIVLAIVPTLAGLEGAWRFIDVAFMVVLLSMLLQGPSLAWLARRLGLDRTAPVAAERPSAVQPPGTAL
jgi:cell volume regulation protein A